MSLSEAEQRGVVMPLKAREDKEKRGSMGLERALSCQDLAYKPGSLAELVWLHCQ